MAAKLTWLGHGSWSLATNGHHVLLDPFLSESPVAPVKADDVQADHILVSHGHFDHIADAANIANRTGATVIANFEIAEWLRTKQQVEHTLGMNLGGGIQLPFGHVKMTPAWHSSQLPDGSYGGTAAGFVVTIDNCRIYFACDTGLFGDMELIGEQDIDLAVLPIGDLFTMGPEDSLQAIRLIRPRRVVPTHYNTWPPIAQDATVWAEKVRRHTRCEPVVIAAGESLELFN
jgi:L-ascorbate metabolism protein UlaG (beta-lactamase superfamily)